MEKVENGKVPEVFRGAKFLSIVFSFGQLCTMEKVEQKVEDVKEIVKSYMNI